MLEIMQFIIVGYTVFILFFVTLAISIPELAGQWFAAAHRAYKKSMAKNDAA